MSKMFCIATYLFLRAADKWLSPPEQCWGGSSRGETELETSNIEKKGDVWNLGVLLHCLLSGKIPCVQDDKVIIDKNIAFETKDLLLSMLEMNPDKRITLEEVLNSI